nr:MAG TPA: hypothetical protein [Bacteriophage sp.]
MEFFLVMFLKALVINMLLTGIFMMTLICQNSIVRILIELDKLN